MILFGRFLSDFLVSVVTSIFEDRISMDSLIVQVLHQGLRLLEADRASLFLVDTKTQQLYARWEGGTGTCGAGSLG
jgi:cAMP and cAMP-inhibited cGMP 3',5'-cyclic phosphodiesterase 10